MNPEPPGTQNGFWMPTVVFAQSTGVTRENLVNAFRAEEIDARVFFWPLSGLPQFEAVEGNVNSWSIPSRAINLPSFHTISEHQVEQISDVVRCLTRDKSS
jgi:perosamine synthetase